MNLNVHFFSSEEKQKMLEMLDRFEKEEAENGDSESGRHFISWLTSIYTCIKLYGCLRF